MSTVAQNISVTLLCLVSAAAFGCHQDVISESTSSATDDDHFFGSTSASPDTEMVPTTSAGEPTGGPVNPSDFCKLHPTEDYPGFVYVCSGEVSGGVMFDYYGDPDLPIHSYVPCLDMTQPPFDENLPADYVYTCFVNVADYAFDPETPQPNGHQVDACCERDAPLEATIDYCRIDAAEEFCSGAVDGLNQFRAQLPALASLAELNHQLENLNKYLADSGTQTSCAQTLGEGFVATGNFQGPGDGVGWDVDHPEELDPEVGWPWFRNIRTGVSKLEISMSENNGLSCTQLEGDAVTGVLGDGAVSIESHLGEATVTAAGEGTFHRAKCRLDSCEFKLETFDLRLNDFRVGTMSFTDVSVSLAAPATGLINGDAVGIAESAMHLTATFRLTAEGKPQFDGAPVSVGLRNHGVARLRALPDSLVIEALDVSRWPFEMSFVSQISP